MTLCGFGVVLGCCVVGGALSLSICVVRACVFGSGTSGEPDTHVLPPEVDRIFRKVQDEAHYMPNWQMEVRVQVNSDSKRNGL